MFLLETVRSAALQAETWPSPARTYRQSERDQYNHTHHRSSTTTMLGKAAV